MSNNWDAVNRRKVIKSIGVASGSFVTGSLGIGTAAANSGTTPSEGDIEIVDTEIKHDTSVSSLTGSSTTDETQISADARIQQQKPKKVLKQLIDLMEQKSGLTAAKEKGTQKAKKKKETPYANVTVDFTTDNQNVNSYNPALDVIPFGNKKKNNSADQQGSGLLFVYTVVENGRRVPVGVLGLTQTQTPDGNTSIRSYLIDEGEPVQANHIPTADEDSISTKGLWACSACTTLVGGVCDYGMVVVGQYACVGMCVAAFNANFVAAYGCASICSTMFSVIAAVGCAAGGTVVCQEMTERTPDNINFC